MVIFYSYVGLPEGKPGLSRSLFDVGGALLIWYVTSSFYPIFVFVTIASTMTLPEEWDDHRKDPRVLPTPRQWQSHQVLSRLFEAQRPQVLGQFKHSAAILYPQSHHGNSIVTPGTRAQLGNPFLWPWGSTGWWQLNTTELPCSSPQSRGLPSFSRPKIHTYIHTYIYIYIQNLYVDQLHLQISHEFSHEHFFFTIPRNYINKGTTCDASSFECPKNRAPGTVVIGRLQKFWACQNSNG